MLCSIRGMGAGELFDAFADGVRGRFYLFMAFSTDNERCSMCYMHSHYYVTIAGTAKGWVQ